MMPAGFNEAQGNKAVMHMRQEALDEYRLALACEEQLVAGRQLRALDDEQLQPALAGHEP